MPLNIQGYVTPEQQFEGLEKFGALQQQRKQRKLLLQQQEQKNKDALAKYGLDLIGKSNDYLTNTIHNPVINQKLGNLLSKAAEFASQQGMNEATMTQLLMPEIIKLKNETENVKQVERFRNVITDQLGKNKSINLDKFNENYTRNAYLNPDNSIKDMSIINPLEDYATKALSEGDVYNENAVEGFLNKYKEPLEVREKFKEVLPNKKTIASMAQVKYPQYLQPIKDVNGYVSGFRPKGELVTDEKEKGFLQKALDLGANDEVGLLDKSLYESDDNLKRYVAQQTEKVAKEVGLDLDKVDDETLDKIKRAIAYKLIEPNKSQGKIVKEQLQQAAPITKVTVNTGGGKNNETNINDLYKEINDEMEISKAKGFELKAVNLLSTEAQTYLINEAKKLRSDQDLSNEDIVLWKKGKDIAIYKASNGKPIMTNDGLIGYLTPKGVNIKSQPTAKGKTEVIKQGNKEYKNSPTSKGSWKDRAKKIK